MSTNCDACGYRDNEVKSGGAISPEGRKLTLTVQDSEDLSRDVLKSETAGFEIPEIDLKLQPGTLGGRFTTLEGLLQQVYDELSQRVMAGGDSSTENGRNQFESFLGKLKSVISAEACPFTVVLDDPLANSYIQNPYAPDKDEQMEAETYMRSWDQNEDLGLNDINVSFCGRLDVPLFSVSFLNNISLDFFFLPSQSNFSISLFLFSNRSTTTLKNQTLGKPKSKQEESRLEKNFNLFKKRLENMLPRTLTLETRVMMSTCHKYSSVLCCLLLSSLPVFLQYRSIVL